MRIATANLAQALDREGASVALGRVLETEPDLVALQEWNLPRRGLLASVGSGYHWWWPVVGGCVVGARRARYEPLSRGVRLLSRPGAPGRRESGQTWQPGRLAAHAAFRDREDGAAVGLVSYHLVSGTRARGRVREDRPRLVARHRGEEQRLQGLLDRLRAQPFVTWWAAGDANREALVLTGLVSAWSGRDLAPGQPGTLGHRRVDDVHGPSAAREVRMVRTGSDHQAVVADW